MTEKSDNKWHGSPLEVSALDPYDIKEIIIEHDTGYEEVLRPQLRNEYGSYELQQAAVYLGTLAGELRRNGGVGSP